MRRATAADAREIARASVDAWRAAYSHVFAADYLDGLSVDERARRAAERIAGGSVSHLVAELGGRVVGYVAFGRTRDEDDHAAPAEVYAINVHPSAWGKGVGRALLSRAEAALHEAGFEEAALWVLEDNPRARRFYESAGWSTDGARKTFSAGGADAAEIRFRKPLV